MRAPTLFIVDDEPDVVDIQSDILSRAGYPVLGATSVPQALKLLESNFTDLLVVDERIGRNSGTQMLQDCRLRFPGLAGIVISGHADLNLAIKAMRAGAFDLLVKPIDKAQLLGAVERVLAASEVVREARYARWEAARSGGLATILGQSPTLEACKRLVEAAAPTDASVLVTGESGTGKELFARAIHALSPRRDARFVAVNLSAIPRELGESALFGHRKGSFTGAISDQIGFFESARGGTLFLDEVGDANPALQAALLRSLQEREFVRIGDTEPRTLDVRIVAATHHDLSRLIRKQRFREDLYFRLAVITIELPPLRTRVSDIPLLAKRIADGYAAKINRSINGFSPEALSMLQSYAWPGNVRELENAVQRAVILSDSGVITPAVLALGTVKGEATRFADLLDGDFRRSRERFERAYFMRLLKRSGDNRTKAAEAAGIDRATLHDYLNRLSIGKKATKEKEC